MRQEVLQTGSLIDMLLVFFDNLLSLRRLRLPHLDFISVVLADGAIVVATSNDRLHALAHLEASDGLRLC